MPTAAAAQEAGFRPCMRCRPENSPEVDAWRGTAATVSRAMKLIETGAISGGKIGSLADRLGIGDRQLRRLFRQHVGAAPVTVAQTHRVLLARQLLHQTDLSMIDVALASGFGSVRRFNEVFQRLYQRSPRELRGRSASPSSVASIELLLPYRPPYDWEAMIGFLRVRAITGLETIADDVYSRVIELDESAGSITVAHAPEHSALRIVVAFPDLSSLSTIIARVRRMFDLGAEPGAIAAALSADPVLAPLVVARPGVRLPGAWDGFEVAVRAVLGQQITVKAATRLASRVVAELGAPISERDDSPGLTRAFPRSDRFDLGVLSGLGMPKARAATLAGIATAVRADPTLFDPGRDLAEAVTRLRNLPGVGEWTAQYIAMRAMGESDAFLAGDIAVRRKFAQFGPRLSEKQLLAHAERWRPWRAYAVLHLWTAEAAVARAS